MKICNIFGIFCSIWGCFALILKTTPLSYIISSYKYERKPQNPLFFKHRFKMLKYLENIEYKNIYMYLYSQITQIVYLELTRRKSRVHLSSPRGSWKYPELKWRTVLKMADSIQNSGQYSKWREIFKMADSIQNGRQNYKRRTIFKIYDKIKLSLLTV